MGTAMTTGGDFEGNRHKLLVKRRDYSKKIAEIDEAIGLLDKNPELERLADILPKCLGDRDSY